MADYWYENIKLYGNETYVPKKLCENPYCLYGEESGKIGRSINVKEIYYDKYVEYKHYKCNNCGHEWKKWREDY